MFFSDGSPVLVAKRSSSGATTQYHIEKLSKFLKNYGSEEWLLDQILDQKYLHNIKVLTYILIASHN